MFQLNRSFSASSLMKQIFPQLELTGYASCANSCHPKFLHDLYVEVKFPVRTEHYFVVMQGSLQLSIRILQFSVDLSGSQGHYECLCQCKRISRFTMSFILSGFTFWKPLDSLLRLVMRSASYPSLRNYSFMFFQLPGINKGHIAYNFSLGIYI